MEYVCILGDLFDEWFLDYVFFGCGIYENLGMMICFCYEYLFIYNWLFGFVWVDGYVLFDFVMKECIKVDLLKGIIRVELEEDDEDYEGKGEEEDEKKKWWIRGRGRVIIIKMGNLRFRWMCFSFFVVSCFFFFREEVSFMRIML